MPTSSGLERKLKIIANIIDVINKYKKKNKDSVKDEFKRKTKRSHSVNNISSRGI